MEHGSLWRLLRLGGVTFLLIEDIREAGGKDREGAKDEQIGIDIGNGIGHDALQEVGQMRLYGLRKGTDFD